MRIEVAKKKSGRRSILKGAAIGAAWTAPVIQSVVIPSHAATINSDGDPGTGTMAPTTPSATTTSMRLVCESVYGRVSQSGPNTCFGTAPITLDVNGNGTIDVTAGIYTGMIVYDQNGAFGPSQLFNNATDVMTQGEISRDCSEITGTIFGGLACSTIVGPGKFTAVPV